MKKKPIRVFYSPLTQRFYATQYYRQEAPGIVICTGEKYDVTSDIGAIVDQHQVTFIRQLSEDDARDGASA